ncbi:hypothetical protein [Roseomonas sp. CECT 9278]|uniref:hypothetical protein n=1 Tax=Roseomonas sp. CECT 9278 TaxID=2845823 RepID=UPI001E637BF2|nr:hypothetical protein [Roseomonas sp. CECT 9278]CAH0207208.1 hypothetical protein ROS9278_02076 [Roseomonas sp. CECT 9278]
MRASPKLSILLVAALAALPGAARAQDSFVREADFLTGRPLLSVLGSGVGQVPASLTLEFSCPGHTSWSLDLRGARFPDGAAITLDLGGAGGDWHEVRLLSVQRPDADWLRLGVDEASFRAALARARAAGEAPGTTSAVLLVGPDLGVAVGLDSLAREIGALAHDCAAQRSAQPRAGTTPGVAPLARYAR